jgi:hypothetical protein
MLNKAASGISVGGNRTGLIESSGPRSGFDVQSQIDDDTSSVLEHTGIEPTEDLSRYVDLLPDVADVSRQVLEITVAVTGAAFLVTHWLVGEGEG